MFDDVWVTPEKCLSVLMKAFQNPYRVEKVWDQRNKTFFITVLNEDGGRVAALRVYTGKEHSKARRGMVPEHSLTKLRKLGLE